MLGSSLIGGGAAKAALGPTKELEKIFADIEPIQEKLNANQAKFARQQEEINELLRVQPFLEGQTSKKIKQSAEARAEAGAALSENKRKIRDLNTSQRGLTKAADGYTKEIEQANRAATKQNNIVSRRNLLLQKSQKLAGGIAGKGAALRGAVVGAGGGLAARAAFNAASQKESAGVRVEVLEQEFNQLIGIQEAAARSAEKFILSETQVLQSYIDLGNRLGEQGASVADLENIYDGLNTVLVKNRASTQEAASATLQLNQALGAGKLQGEEFRAINEAAPQVISEVSRVLGVQRGEVKQLAADGKVSSEVLIRALTNIKKNGADALEEGFTGAFGATRRFDKAIREFSEAVGAQLLPAITPIIEGLTAVLNAFNELDPRIQTAIVGFTALAAAVLVLGPPLIAVTKGLVSVSAVFGALKLGAAAAGVGKLALAFTGLKVVLAGLLGPWGLLAAGVAVAGVAIGRAVMKQREYNQVINGAEFQQKKFNDILYEKKKRLEEAQAKLKELEEKGKGFEKRTAAQAKEVEKLQKELNKLQGTYNVRIQIQTAFEDALAAKGQRMGEDGLEVRIGNKWYDKNNNVVEVIETPKPQVDLSSLSGDSSSSSSSGSKAPESRLPQLNREIDLQRRLNDLNRQSLEAQLKENSALVEALQMERIQVELEARKAEIEASTSIADADKPAEKLKAELEARQELDNIVATTQQRTKDEAQARIDALKPLEDQRRLLEAQLQGRGEEEQILQEIDAILKSVKGLDKKRVEELVRGNKELEKQKALLDFNKQIVAEVVNGAGRELVGLFEALVEGTEDWNKTLQNTLRSLSRLLFSAGLKALGGNDQIGLFSILSGNFGGPKAAGGPVSGGTSYLVGEKGPELFTPGTSGNITPNDALGGSTVVNITVNDNGGGSASGSGPNANEARALARMIESSTLAIINREKRPGGTLSFSR